MTGYDHADYALAGKAGYDGAGEITYAQRADDYQERTAEYLYRLEMDFHEMMRALKTEKAQKARLNAWLYPWGLEVRRRPGRWPNGKLMPAPLPQGRGYWEHVYREMGL